MTFTNLIFLFGALAVAGPLLAHLWATPRYRRVPFTMIRFLKLGQEKNQSRQNLKNFLILLLRCACIVLIAMLFAGPNLLLSQSPQAEPQKNSTACYLALDDSLSMAYRDGKSSYFERMIERTQAYIASAPAGSSFNLYGLASGKSLTRAGKDEAGIFLRKLRVNPGEAHLTDFLGALKGARNADPCPEKVFAFLAGDFTPRMMEKLSQIDEDIPVDDLRYERIASGTKVDNLAITDAHAVWDTPNTLLIRTSVMNYGQADHQNRLSVRIDGKVVGEMTADLKAGGRNNITFRLPIPDPKAPWLRIELHIENADGLSQDNTFYLPVSIPEPRTLRVLLAGETPREMFLPKTAMETLAGMNTGETLSIESTTFSKWNPSDLHTADVLILTRMSPELKGMTKALSAFVARGGKIIFFATESCAPVAKVLNDEGLLPAAFQTFEPGTNRLESGPSATHWALESGPAASALPNYNMDRIVFHGFYECRPCDRSVCVWRFENQAGFIYLREIGKGQSVLVNIGTDETLGLLMKSPAAVSFCRYLLGRTTQPHENKVTVGEPILFPRREPKDPAQTSTETLGVLSPSGRNLRATGSQDSFILNYSEESGFFRTIEPPLCYAGVNPREGETDMRKPVDDELRKLLEQKFTPASEHTWAGTESPETKQYRYKPMGNYFVWLLIVLITAEAFITNRMQR